MAKQMTRIYAIIATALLSIIVGWVLGQRYSDYVLFFGIEPYLHPCPYEDMIGSEWACNYRPDRPEPDIAVWWHGWPTQDGQLIAPQPTGNCLMDILYFDPLPPPDSP